MSAESVALGNKDEVSLQASVSAAPESNPAAESISQTDIQTTVLEPSNAEIKLSELVTLKEGTSNT